MTWSRFGYEEPVMDSGRFRHEGFTAFSEHWALLLVFNQIRVTRLVRTVQVTIFTYCTILLISAAGYEGIHRHTVTILSQALRVLREHHQPEAQTMGPGENGK